MCILDVSMETDDAVNSGSYWEKFLSLATELQSLNLLHFFIDHAVTEVIQKEVVKAFVYNVNLYTCTCSLLLGNPSFKGPYLEA